MKRTFLVLCILFFSCNTENPTEQINDKIKVLNFGTFHFGFTPDANKTEFDKHSEEAQKEIREISKMLAQFKPTIICVENLPKFNIEINKAYQDFLDNPSTLNTNHGESSMIGFDVGD